MKKIILFGLVMVLLSSLVYAGSVDYATLNLEYNNTDMIVANTDADAISTDTTWTLCGFIYINAGATNCKMMDSTAGRTLVGYDMGGTDDWEYYNGVGGYEPFTATDYPYRGQWVYVCTMSNATKLKAYFNASLWGSEITEDGADGIGGEVCLGGNDGNCGADAWDGNMTGILVFENSLTGDEIEDVYCDQCIEVNKTYGGVCVGLPDFCPAPAPPPAGSTEITLLEPADNSANNTAIQNWQFNVTNTTECKLYINDTAWTNVSTISATANITQSFDYTITNGEGGYAWNVECDGGFATSNFTFSLDTTDPTITDNLIPIVFNGSLYGNILFQDEREIYSINVTWWNGTSIYENTNIGLSSIQVNFSNEVDDTTSGNITARICDAHTSNLIEEFDDVKEEDGGFKFVKNKIFWFWDGEHIKIYPKDKNKYHNPKTEKKLDRYTFEFNKLENAGASETFIIESTSYIDIVKGQNYIGHLISFNNWIDFQNEDITDYTITRISDKKVEVTLYGLSGTSFKFNSIGELNCITDTLYYGNLNPVSSASSLVRSNTETTFNLSIQNDPNTMTIVNTTLHYNGSQYKDTSSPYSVSLTAPEVETQETKYFSWIVTIDGSDYNVSSGSQSVANYVISNCSSAPAGYTNNATTLNYSVRNITSDALVNVTIETTFEWATGNYSQKDTDATTQTFCVYPSGASITSDITTEYYLIPTEKFSYVGQSVVFDNQQRDIDLYLTDETTLITFTIKDEVDNKLQNVILNILKWDIATNTFRSASSIETDFNGQAFAYLNLYNTWYKFIVIQDGSVILETNPAKISSTSVNIIVNLASDVYREDLIAEGMFNSLNYDNDTLLFTYTFQETTADVSSSRLELYRQTLNGITLENTTTLASDSGSIVLKVNDPQEDTFVVKSYSTINGQEVYTGSLSHSFDEKWRQYGLEGVFVAFLLIVTIVMVGLWQPSVAIILSVLGLIVTNLIGLITLNVGWVFAILILGIITIARMNKK